MKIDLYKTKMILLKLVENVHNENKKGKKCNRNYQTIFFVNM